jgi:hypothetical protein
MCSFTSDFDGEISGYSPDRLDSPGLRDDGIVGRDHKGVRNFRTLSRQAAVLAARGNL